MPNKRACMFIWHIRVPTQLSNLAQVVIDRMADHLKTLGSTNITYDHSLGTSAVQVVSKARQGYKY